MEVNYCHKLRGYIFTSDSRLLSSSSISRSIDLLFQTIKKNYTQTAGAYLLGKLSLQQISAPMHLLSTYLYTCLGIYQRTYLRACGRTYTTQKVRNIIYH